MTEELQAVLDKLTSPEMISEAVEWVAYIEGWNQAKTEAMKAKVKEWAALAKERVIG